jgi:hypothetical protein
MMSDRAMTDWHAIAASLPRPAFAARHAHPFLLVLQDIDEDPQEFRTAALERGSVELPIETDAPGSVLALVKSAANPYGAIIIVGRARNCDVVLRHPSISKVHAAFRVIGPGEAELIDRGSRNGVTVNGRPLEPATPVVVRGGDRVVFGSVPTAFLDPVALHEAIT